MHSLLLATIYGICAHLPRNDEYATLDDELALMSQAGITSVRCDIDWSVKKNPDTPWNFSRFDQVLEAAAARNIEVLPILNTPPKWATPVSEHLEDFRAYVEEVLDHVDGKCSAIEVWNEENLPGNFPDPAVYLKVLKIAHETIKARNPQIKVAFGGVTEFGLDYLEAIYRMDGARYFDIYCCHPYTLPYPPEGRLDTGLRKLKALMAKYGDASKPIWITEIGYPTHRNGVGTTETQVLLSGLRIARPGKTSWRVACASIASDAVRPSQDFADELLSVLPAGSTAVVCAPKELAGLLATNGVDAVVYPMDSEGYPAATIAAVTDFVRRGGVLVETGGAPMYEAYVVDAKGDVGKSRINNPEVDRRGLRLGFSAWWCNKDEIPQSTPSFATQQAVEAGFKAHPAGYSGSRFVTAEYLKDGDEFIPLIVGKSKSGRDLASAAVLKFDSDFKGCLIVSCLQKGYGPVAHTETQQADYLVRAAKIARDEGVERFYPYELKADEYDPYYSEHHFGIVHRDLKPKPAYKAYAEFILSESLPEKPGIPPDEYERRFQPTKNADLFSKEFAEEALAAPIPETPDELYLEFSTNGNRSRYEKNYFLREHYLDALAIAEYREREGRYLKKIEQILAAIVEMKTWCLPAHDGSLEAFRGETQIVDLFASQYAAHLACVLQMVGDRLDPALVQRVGQEVERRVLDPIRREDVEHPTKHHGWIRNAYNWNAVCWNNVVCAALYFSADRQDRAHFVAGALASAKIFLSGFPADGYCHEGMGYWNYGYGYHLMMARLLEEVSSGRIVAVGDPKERIIASYGRRGAFDLKQAPAFADGIAGPGQRILVLVDHFWPEMPRAFAPSTVFEEAQVWLFRNPDGLSVAFKGGSNGVPHGHCDLGSYDLRLRGEAVAGDPGGEVYTARTFSAKRYESKVLNSYGHPVPVVGGQLQGVGEKYRAKVVSSTINDSGVSEVVLDLTGAYEVDSLVSLTRTFLYDRPRGVFSVVDRVCFSKPTAFEDAYTVLPPANLRPKVSVEGATYEVREERIDNPGRISPLRVGIRLDSPVTTATVRFDYSCPQLGWRLRFWRRWC